MIKQKKVVWIEGMNLSQQHLQCWDQSHEAFLQVIQNNFFPFGYGVIEWDIDRDDLALGLLRIKKLEAIFPNRQWIQFNSQQGKPLSCQLRLEPGQVEEIFIGLPVNQEVGNINGYPASQTICRWNGSYEAIEDCYDNDRKTEILLAEPELYLLTSRTGLEQFYAIKVAEVFLDTTYQVKKDYYIPSIFISSDDNLHNELLSFITFLNTKIQILKSQLSGMNMAGDVNLLNHISSITTQSIARLQILSCQYHATPEKFYTTCMDLLSYLAGLSRDACHFQIIEYEHEHLARTFHNLKEQLEIMYHSIIPTSYKNIALEEKDKNHYFSQNIEFADLNEGRIYLIVTSPMVGSDWKDNFIQSIKIASMDDLSKIVSSSIPGVSLKTIHHPPGSITLAKGQHLFEMINHGMCWDQILVTRNLGIFVPELFHECQITLVVHRYV